MKENFRTLLLFTAILLVATILCNSASAQCAEPSLLPIFTTDGFSYYPVSDFHVPQVQELPNINILSDITEVWGLKGQGSPCL